MTDTPQVLLAHHLKALKLPSFLNQSSTRFFPEASLNYAENLLAHMGTGPALIAHRDDGMRRELCWDDLRALVSRLAQALRATGIEPGDRVAAIVTNDLEAIAGYLACAAIGAVWASCSPDFGPSGVSRSPWADRTENAVRRAGLWLFRQTVRHRRYHQRRV